MNIEGKFKDLPIEVGSKFLCTHDYSGFYNEGEVYTVTNIVYGQVILEEKWSGRSARWSRIPESKPLEDYL